MKALTQLVLVLAAFTALLVTLPPIGQRRIADVTVDEAVSVAWRLVIGHQLYRYVRENLNKP